MKHTKNIKVKTGEYQKDGKTVGKYLTVGKVLTDDNGKDMVLLDRTFNPAGCPNDGHDSIILNFWDAEGKREVPEEAQKGLGKLYYDEDPPF